MTLVLLCLRTYRCLGCICMCGVELLKAVVGLMDRVLDLKPEVTQGCGFESRLRPGSPRLLPGRCTVGCPLLQVCTLGWVKCREHISLLIILCIIVYVTNKAHLSLICICCCKIGTIPFWGRGMFVLVI